LWTAAHIRQILDIEQAAAMAYGKRAADLFRELAGVEPDAFSDHLAAVEALRANLAKHEYVPD
jgi:hypothetical protein